MDQSSNRFFKSGHVRGNVVFNFSRWAANDINAYAKGYHDAAKVLVKSLASGGGYRDYDGYPILFLYRHALELRIKAVVHRGAMLAGLISDERDERVEGLDSVDKKLWRNHKLCAMLPFLAIIRKVTEWEFNGDHEGIRSYEDFKSLLEEFDRIDPRASSFRYPITSEGHESLPHHFVVNVVQFAAKMEPILNLLDGVAAGIDYCFNERAEARYEWQQEMRSALDGLS